MTKPKHGPLLIGALSPTKYGKTGKSFIQESWGETPSTRVTNANSPGTYSAKQDLSYRGMDVRHPSRGVG
jgi:hypothetical protein